MLPTFIDDLIFICIGGRYCGCRLRCIPRLIVEFRIFDSSSGDGTCWLWGFLHDQVIGNLIDLILVDVQIFVHAARFIVI